jgi:hypothetical protein
MSTVISVCNLALAHIGKADISDLSSATAEARACRRFWDHARQTMLHNSSWTFALRREPMAELANDFVQRWPFRYARPASALKLLSVVPPGLSFRHGRAMPPFEVREGSVYTTVPQAEAEMVVDVTDPALFPPLFTHALSFHLATMIARPLTRSRALTEEMRRETELALSLAITADASQDAPQYGVQPFDDYTRERF